MDVALMLNVPILLEVISVHASLDTMGMDFTVMVCVQVRQKQ